MNCNEEDEMIPIKNSILAFVIIQYQPEREISVAVCEEHKRMFQICSFSDNEHYSNFESLIIQLNPKEDQVEFKVHLIVKTDINSEREKIFNKLADVQYDVYEPNKITSTSMSLAMEFLLINPLNHYLQVTAQKKGVAALEKLLTLANLEKDQSNKNQYELSLLSLEKYMKLDKPVINALQIFPKEMGKKYYLAGASTLYDILNQCKTLMGNRCLKRWMKQPLQSVQELERRLDHVEFFLKNNQIKNTIQNQLKKIPDLDNLFYAFYRVKAGKKRSNVDVNDLMKIYRTVKTLEDMVSNLAQKTVDHPLLDSLVEGIEKNITPMKKIKKMIEDNLVMDDRENQHHVRPNAQQQLLVISREKEEINGQIAQHMRRVSKQLGRIDVNKLHSTTHKYVFEADKKSSIETVKENEDYKFLTAKQNKITFTTQTLISYCKRLMVLDDEYKEQEKEILTKMFGVVAGYYPVMEKLSLILSQLDVMTTFATVINSISTNASWTRPRFSEFIVGRKIHHPCVRTCIPNDIDLSEKRTVILTGPNMGGKSTYIRTIGITVYLAHIGCFVPARDFETPIVDSIITRVGASDMQIKGISTFMNEMIESACMLQTATRNSLVLIDELGRGTSTAEGFGLAWGICQELHTKIGSFCLFATHFHEMTQMAEQIQGVKNMYTSCKIDKNQLKLEYKVVEGKIQKSYGIQVAKMLSFPPEIIAEAEKYLHFYESQIETPTKKEGHILNHDKKNLALELYEEMERKLQKCSLEETEQIKNDYRSKIKAILN